MGAVKAVVSDMAETGLILAELDDSSVRFALTSADSGWSWYLAPTGDEYEQEDWIFHALRRGTSSTFPGAVTELAEAVVAFFPDTSFAMARRPKGRQLRSVR